jgi:hypothetical protein
MVWGPHFCLVTQPTMFFVFEIWMRWIKLEHLKRDVEKELTTHTCLCCYRIYVYTHRLWKLILLLSVSLWGGAFVFSFAFNSTGQNPIRTVNRFFCSWKYSSMHVSLTTQWVTCYPKICHSYVIVCHYFMCIRGAAQNFREFEYTAQTISATNLRC